MRTLEENLAGYDNLAKSYLVDGFRYGFRIPCDNMASRTECKNLQSALSNQQVVDEKITKDLILNRVAGPFDSPPFEHFVVSPIGVVAKKEPGKFRLIHHLSYPKGQSVNDHIPHNLTTVHYAKFDDATAIVKKLGHGCFLAKTDIEAAYRIVPVHPQDYHLLGFQWKGKYYYHKVLPMGLSVSSRIFEAFSTALEWIAKHKANIRHIIHILDDFLMGERSRLECQQALQRFIALCQKINIPLAPGKTVGPDTALCFVGIEIDTIIFQARLPEDKISKCQTALQTVHCKKKATLRQIQSLVGLLNFACCVVVPGRAFLRRLINLTIGVRCPWYKITLTKPARSDIAMWECFIAHFNGRALLLHEPWVHNSYIQLYTDASGAIGYGAILGSRWLAGKWPTEWSTFNIMLLELYPIVAAVDTWGYLLANKKVLFHTDNLALVHAINKTTSTDKSVMSLIRVFVLSCMKHNLMFKATHIPSKQNILADHLSRNRLQEFHELAPWADGQESLIRPQILPENWQWT